MVFLGRRAFRPLAGVHTTRRFWNVLLPRGVRLTENRRAPAVRTAFLREDIMKDPAPDEKKCVPSERAASDHEEGPNESPNGRRAAGNLGCVSTQRGSWREKAEEPRRILPCEGP